MCVRFWAPIGLIQCIGGPNLAAAMWTLFLLGQAAGVRLLGQPRIETQCPLDSTMGLLFCSPQQHVARVDLGLALGQRRAVRSTLDKKAQRPGAYPDKKWPCVVPHPQRQFLVAQRCPTSSSIAFSICATTATHASSERVASSFCFAFGPRRRRSSVRFLSSHFAT